MGNDAVNNDGGYYAIKGFLFQFDKQIIEIINNPDKSINIERSQDIDYDDYYIQVKCHEKTNFSPSRLRKPIIQLIEKHKVNNSAKFCLYCHFFDNKPEKKVVDTTFLDVILGDEKSNYSLPIKQAFLGNFVLEFCSNYANQFDEVIKLIGAKFKCAGNDVVYIYHSIIRNFLLKVVIEKEKHDRKVSFDDINKTIDKSLHTLTLHGYFRYLDEDRYVKLLKDQYFTSKKANINNFERLFIIEIDNNNLSHIESLIRVLNSKYYVRNKSPLPYVSFKGISKQELTDTKISLIDHGIRFNDGTLFDGDKFRLREIVQKSQPEYLSIKILGEEYINLLLEELPVQEVYQFYRELPFQIENEVDKHILIQYVSITQVLKMLQ